MSEAEEICHRFTINFTAITSPSNFWHHGIFLGFINETETFGQCDDAILEKYLRICLFTKQTKLAELTKLTAFQLLLTKEYDE